MFFLRHVRWNAKRVATGPRAWRAHGELTDLLGGGDVAVQKRGREICGAYVIKALADVVLWQKGCRIDVQSRQVTNCVLIFRSIEAAESFRAPRIWIFF